MPLHHCRDLAPARWLTGSGTPFAQLVGFGPAGFEAYARLRFIADPVRAGQAETDVDLPEDHLPDHVQGQRAWRVLEAFTTTPADCYVCVWEGFGGDGLPPGVLEGPLVTVPHRRYVLFRAPLADLVGLRDDFGGGRPPAFVWPADRSWCFACDVDPHWAGIGGSRAAVDALLDEPGLDVVPARPDEPQPAYR